MNEEKSAETGTGTKRRWLSSLATPAAWLSPRRVRFWLLIALLIYALAGFFLAPWLVGRAAIESVSETGRSLQLGGVRINPFALSLTVQDAQIHDTDGAVLFSLDNAYLNFQLSSLFRWAWTFRDFRLLNPYIDFERFRPGDDRISRFVQAFTDKKTPEQPAPTEPGDLPRLILQHLDLTKGRLRFTDHLEEQTFQADLGPIQIDIRNLTTLPDESGRQQVNIRTLSGGTIAWKGKLQLSPLLSEGHLTISGLALEGAERYLNLLVPFIMKSGVADIALDYRVEMRHPTGLGLQVYNFSGDVKDIGLRLADFGSDSIKLPQLEFTGGALQWPEKQVSLESLSAGDALVNVTRLEDGKIDLLHLMPPTTDSAGQTEGGADTAPAGTKPAGDWAVNLEQFAVTGAAIRFEDRGMEPAATVSISRLDLTASELSNRPDTKFPVHLALELAQGGTVGFDGEAGVLPVIGTSGELTVDGAELAIAQPWIAGLAHVEVKSGSASLKGKLVHGPQESAGYQGSAHIEGFELRDTRRDGQLAGLQTLDIEHAAFSLTHRTLETSMVQLTRPYGRIAIAPDKTTNLKGLMVETNAPEGPGEGNSEEIPATKPLAITLDGFEIKDASLDFSDRSLPLPFGAVVHSLGGTISTLSNTSAEPANVQLEGQVDEYGLARISGTINAWSPFAHSDLNVIFRNLKTARLSPYTIGFAGYKIADGRLDLDLHYRIEDGKMQGSNKIVSRQLKLGDKVETGEDTSLPLQLAVALLTDSNGVIDLDLPVSGDINDPQFRLGGVITKAIMGLIGKIVTAPFRWLGKLVGVQSEDFGTLNFVPGSADIPPPSREKLAKLAEAMEQRPELALEVGGVYAADADRAALKARQLDLELDAQMEALAQGSEERSSVLRRRAMESVFTQTFPDTPLESVQAEYLRAAGDENSTAEPVMDVTAYLAGLRDRLVEQQQVADEQLTGLAKKRADAVIAVLMESARDSELSLKRDEARAVKATDSGEIPLELQVSVAKSTD